MTHDPLCPWHGYDQEEVSCRDSETLITFCEVIAKVREDERERAIQDVRVAALERMRALEEKP